MVPKLETGKYPAVHALAQEMPSHLAIESVLKGKFTGIVINDDPVKPAAAFISAGNIGFFLGSHGNLSFNEELSNTLQKQHSPEIARSGHGLFLLYHAASKSVSEIEAVLGR